MAIPGEIRSAFLKSAVDLLLLGFSSPEVQRFFRRQKPNKGRLPLKLTEGFKSINSMLLDAEEKQTTEAAVKDWLDKVQHVVYEAEDWLDVILCQARVSKVKPGYTHSNVSLKCYLDSFDTEEKIIKDLEDILERLKLLEDGAHTLRLKKSFKESRLSFGEVEFGSEFLSRIRYFLDHHLDFMMEFSGFFRRQILDYGFLEKSKEILKTIKILLRETEMMQITNEGVKNWLQPAKDALNEAAYLLDCIVYKAGGGKLKFRSPIYSVQIQNVFFSLFSSNENEKVETMVENLADILKKLERVVNEGEKLYNLPQSDGGHPISDPCVYGRDDAKNTIKHLLQSEDEEGKSLEAIVVQGVAGIGKTTFAKLVYLDADVQSRFDLKAWVYVSQEFDSVRIVGDILKNIDPSRCVTMDANELQNELKNKLTGKKLLLVLDEVWKADDQHAQWNFLVTALECAAQGSKIIITAREMNLTVATVLPCVITLFNLKEISDDDCWALFSERAFLGENSQARLQFDVNFRSKVVERCGGIPLRARRLGDYLQRMPDMDWEEISSRWDLQTVSIPPIMKSRYYKFPSNLKQCFVYCALFPKGHSFKREEIVLLWLANGFLGRYRGKKVGYSYFKKLVSFSFFQPKSADPSSFVMNDLVHDWAKFIHGESPKTRHIWFASIRRYEDLKNLVGDECHSFRTVLPKSNESLCGDFNDVEVRYVLTRCSRLRVLSFSNVSDLPDEICCLKHLRHLDISGTSIKSLPKTLCMMFNLQTLILRQCRLLAELPANIVKLTELCHLDIRETGLQQMPPEMGKLTKLETLTDFFVGQHNGCRVDELGKLIYLQGELRIWNLQNVLHGLNAYEAHLNDKDLKVLELRWSGRRDTDDSSIEEDVLEALLPSAKVEDLSIMGYGGKNLPGWVGDTDFKKIVNLRLGGCQYCVSLPPLGQLASLKKLLIEEFYKIESIGDEFYGSPTAERNPFQYLESLTFERMLQWREWKSEGRAFPRLQVLCIRKCPSLTTLPSDLPSLVELEIAKCKLMGPPSGCSPAPINKIKLANDFHKVQLEKLSSDSQSLTVDSLHAFCFIRQEIEDWGYSCTTLQKIDITRCPLEFFPLNFFPQLKQLEISRCSKLKSLCGPEEPLGDSMSTKSFFYTGCPTLETLTLSNCSNFESLLCSLPSLVNLKIVACGKLQSLPGMDFSTSLEPLAGNSNWKSKVWEYRNLKLLSLEHCSNFESLFCSLPSLVNLKIVDCGKLQSLPGMDFSTSLEPLARNSNWNSEVWEYPNLKLLSLEHCSNFESLFCSLPSLVNLKIVACGKLQSLPGMDFSTSLEPLASNSNWNSEVWEYPNLKLLSLEHCSNFESLFCSLPSLVNLKIVACGKLQSFPGMDFSTSLEPLAGNSNWNSEVCEYPNLELLSIEHCSNLKTVHCFLPSLVNLELHNCGQLESFLGLGSSPEQGLLSELKSIVIKGCIKLLVGFNERGLGRFPSLSTLSLDYSAEKESSLPGQPTFLSIRDLPNLKSLELQGVTSLYALELNDCPKLQSISEGSLPVDLFSLHIRSCPLLEQRFQQDIGEDWHKISHVPNIWIGDRNINVKSRKL